MIVLYRDPVDAIMSMNNHGLPKIWRRAGRTFKLHKQVDLFLSQLDEMYNQLRLLRSEDYVVLNYTDLLLSSQDYAAPLASFLELPVKNVARAFTLSIKAKPKRKAAGRKWRPPALPTAHHSTRWLPRRPYARLGDRKPLLGSPDARDAPRKLGGRLLEPARL